MTEMGGFTKSLLVFLCGVSSGIFISVSACQDESTLDVTNGCGGIVYITSADNPSIEYKHDLPYENNEACVWTILPEKGLAIDSLIFIVESHGFADNDGLTIISWKHSKEISAQKIEANATGTAINVSNSGHAFLYFSSSNSGNVGTGFKIDIIGVHGETSTNHQALSFNSILNCFQKFSFSYPIYPSLIYEDNLLLSIILQPDHGLLPNQTTLVIDYFDTEANYDYLHQYDLLPYQDSATSTLVGSYAGSYPEGLDGTESSGPRLLLFTTDGSNSGRGFQLQWY